MTRPKLTRRTNQNLWLRRLCDVEDTAVAMLGPLDVSKINPEIIICHSGPALKLFDYWRVVLSSETQAMTFTMVNRLAALVIDKTSGCLLGVLSLSMPQGSPLQVRALCKGSAFLETHWHEVLQLSRCIPTPFFGPYTGGKLLALIASSRDVVRVAELRYSLQFQFMMIRTLHGKGSQYNRLQERGIKLYDVDGDNRGLYGMELRKGALRYLAGEIEHPGKSAMFSYGEQVAHWKERWLPQRIEHVGTPIVVPDRNQYRLTNLIRSKKMTFGEFDGPESEEAA